MKRVYRGRCYDTEKAELIGADELGEVKLYRKKTGEYFLYKETVSNSTAITPISFDQANDWALDKFCISQLISQFGEFKISGEKCPLQLSLDTGIIEMIKRISSEKGISASEFITKLVINYVECKGDVDL